MRNGLYKNDVDDYILILNGIWFNIGFVYDYDTFTTNGGEFLGRSENVSFGCFPELISNPEEYAKGLKGGYNLVVRGTKGLYRNLVLPLDVHYRARHIYFIDEDGNFYFASEDVDCFYKFDVLTDGTVYWDTFRQMGIDGLNAQNTHYCEIDPRDHFIINQF